MTSKIKDLAGHSVLYPYLQRELLQDDIWLFQMLTSRLITALGVWLPPEVYRRAPLLLPHAIRDSSVQWGTANGEGLVCDNNVLLRNLVSSLPFETHRPQYQNRKIGKARGWVAAHVWMFDREGKRTVSDPDTYSFVPNLVWLPQPLALLSDRADSFVQQYLQATSYKLYGHLPIEGPLGETVRAIWSRLEVPSLPEQGLPDPRQLNFFASDDQWVEKRVLAQIRATASSVERILDRGKAVAGLLPKRYRESLGRARRSALEDLAERLAPFIASG